MSTQTTKNGAQIARISRRLAGVMGEDSPSAKLARFREALQGVGYSAREFARRTGRDRSTVENWLKPSWTGEPQLTADDADLLRVNARWLLLGEGPRDLGDVAELAGQVAELSGRFVEIMRQLGLTDKSDNGGEDDPGSLAQC